MGHFLNGQLMLEGPASLGHTIPTHVGLSDSIKDVLIVSHGASKQAAFLCGFCLMFLSGVPTLAIS